MPTNQVQFKERSMRRIIRAGQKEGLVTKSVTVAPEDGTIIFSFADRAQPEVKLDLSRDLDDITNEWDKASGKDAP